MSNDSTPEQKECELEKKTGNRCVGTICEIHGCDCKCHTPPNEQKYCKFHSIMSEQYGEKEKDCQDCKLLNLKGWREKLKLMILDRGHGVSMTSILDEVAELLTQAQHQARREVLEEVEKGIPKKRACFLSHICYECEICDGPYNQAIQEIKDLITRLKELK